MSRPRKPKYVFAVTEGCYSDYRVVAVFSDPAKAREYRHHICSDNDIEQYRLDVTPQEWDETWIRMDREGNTLQTITKHVREGEGGTLGRVWFSDDVMTMYVKTADRDRAIKVANERRTRLIANNLWGNETMKRIRELTGAT